MRLSNILRGLSDSDKFETKEEVKDGVLITTRYLLNEKGEEVVFGSKETDLNEKIASIDKQVENLNAEKKRYQDLLKEETK
jgi:uncharacterized protein YlxW (UPF0749 family)